MIFFSSHDLSLSLYIYRGGDFNYIYLINYVITVYINLKLTSNYSSSKLRLISLQLHGF